MSLLVATAPALTAQEAGEPIATLETPDAEREARVTLLADATPTATPLIVTSTPPASDVIDVDDTPTLTATPTNRPTVEITATLDATGVATAVATAVALQQLYVPLVAVSDADAVAAAADQVAALEQAATPATEVEETAEPTPTIDPWLEALLAQMEAAEAAPALYTIEYETAEDETALSERLTFTATVAESGGSVTAFDDRLEVRFAAGAAEESLAVTVRPAVGKAAPPDSLSLWPFEIVAEGVKSGVEVRQFKQPLEIVLSYEEEWIQGDEESLYLFYYHEEEKSWLPLPSRVDAENNLLIAQSDHLTVFDFDVQNWEAARLPGLDGFQVGGFTGAAQYSYPFELPPGPGGWQPQLTLTYNSQVVDSATHRSQADWVGMGWSLETGYIERNTRGSSDMGDDVFVLMLNGVSYRLLPDGAGRWRTEDDQYLRIQYNGNPDSYGDQDQYWTVWDKEGNSFTFGGPETHRATHPRNAEKWTWRWLLRLATNRFGQSITYNYAYEGVQRNCGTIQSSAGGNDVAAYPAEVLYPNGRYRIQFDRIGRSDYEGGWTDPCANVRFQRSLLSRVRIEHFNGSAWESVRRYDLTYDYNVIFPGVSWQAGGRTPALVKIQEFDATGNGLPASTFTYADNMHLTAAENGYKGRVEFDYTLWSSERGPAGDDAMQSDGKCSLYSWGTNGQTDTVCSSSSGSNRGLYFKAKSGYTYGHIYTANYFRIFRPGGAYRIISKLERWNRDPHEVRIGLNHGGSIAWDADSQFRPLNSSGETVFDSTIVLPATASRMWLTYEGNAILRFFIGYDTLSRYRVTQKRIIDQVTNTTHVFSYSYDEPAVNDPVHSTVIQQVLKDDWTCCRSNNRAYTPEFTEFRGHAMAREKGPDNRVSMTWHRQDDLRKGRAVYQQVAEESFYTPFDAPLPATPQGWSWAGDGARPILDGDRVLRLNNPATNWNVYGYRTVYNVQDGEIAQLQFRIANTGVGTPMAVLALESEDSRRWGVYVKSDRSVVVQRNDGGGYQEVFTLLGAGGFEYDRWYVLQLGVDSVDLVRLWKRDAAPESDSIRRFQGDSVAANKNWRFRSWISAGALALDTYSELRMLTETETKYDVTETASWSRTRSDGKPLLGVKAYWTRPAHVKRLDFGGDARFTGALMEYSYDPALQGGVQYGNITAVVEKAWSGSAFVAQRAVRRDYFPRNETTRYIVGLAGRETVFRCPGGTCSYSEADVQQMRQLIYDGASWWNQPPWDGKLTRERRLVCYATSSNVCTTYGAAGQTRLLFSDASYQYDNAGNLTQQTLSGDYGYQEGGTLFFPTTNLRFLTTAYDTAGYNTYRTSQTNALGHVTSWTYNYRKGVPIQETDPNGLITTAEYDGFGRLTKLMRPGQSSASPSITVGYFDYGVNNQGPFLIDIQQPHSGGVYNVRKVYNGLGQPIQEQVVAAQVNGTTYDVAVDYAYDAYGRRTKETRPYLLAVWTQAAGGTPYRGQYFNNPTAVTSYDAFGRVTRVQSPTPAEYTVFSYPDDLQVRRCDGLNHCTLTLSDVWGRVTEVRPPAEPWLRYSYDAADRLLAVEQRTGSGATLFATTTMSYDLAGRKTAMSDPDLGNWSYTYDGAGNLRTQTDARNCRTTLSYDLLNRVTQKSYTALSGGSCGATTATVSYGYDAYAAGTNYGRGKRTSMTDGSGSTTWVYGDVRGRLTKETKSITGGGSFVTEWAYDAADQLTWMRYPDGEQVTTSYLRQKLPNSVSGTSVYVQSTQYDAAGRLELRLLGADQVRIDPHYHPWTTQGGRMHWLVGRVGSAGAYLQALEYAYDSVGNVSWIKDNLAGGVQTHSFSYDSMDRLLSASAAPAGDGGAYSESYSYDSAGRLVNGPRGSGYVYGDAAHKHAVTAVSGGHSYAYDANGNLTSRTTGGQSFTLTYDAENRLVSVGGAAVATFVYDGDGRRVKATVNGGTSYYAGDHYEVSGGVVKKYYSAGGQRIALRSGGTLHWLLNDHLGGTAHTLSGVTEMGEVRYKAFGVSRFTSGVTPTTYRFTGQREEAALGLYYYNARWYDPALGHFLSPDTIVPGAGNALDYHRYAYVRFNPLKYTDRTGHYSDQALMTHFGCETWACVESHFQQGGSHAGLWGWLDILLKAEDGDAVQAIVVYGGMLSTVSGNFATINGQITVQGPQLHFGKDAPSTPAGAWGEATFARMALMGSWHADHNAFYMGRHGVSVYNQRYTDCRHQDCVTQMLDGAATASSAVAAGCAMAGIAPCAGVAGATSFIFSGAGAGRTVLNVLANNARPLDGAVAVSTWRIGAKYGLKANGFVGLSVSIAQWAWDTFATPTEAQ